MADNAIPKFRTAQGRFACHPILMPFDDPARVPDTLKWAITWFILANHGALPRETALGPEHAASVPIRAADGLRAAAPLRPRPA
jgi:hypothetical protein